MFRTIEELRASIDRVFAYLMKQRRDFCFSVEDETFIVVEVATEKDGIMTVTRRDLEDATLARMYREILRLQCEKAAAEGKGDVDASLLKVKFTFKKVGSK